MINEQIEWPCEAKKKPKTHLHTNCISIDQIPMCQPLHPHHPHLQPQPHPPKANSGIVLQGWESFGPFGFVVKKDSSLFILFCCLLGNIWKKLKAWMTKGCSFRLLYWRIVWGSPSAGGSVLQAFPLWGNAIGQGRTKDLKWGTVQILVGPYVTKSPRGLFVMLGVGPRE